MILDSEKYTYRVTWSEDDDEYVGLCSEFPGLSWLAPSPDEALRGIRKVIEECLKDMMENGEDIPRPISIRQYSGKFMVRVPPEVHRHLALEAAEYGVSLNRIASAKLAH